MRVLEHTDGNEALIRLPSGLGIYVWDGRPDDPETGNQVCGGLTGYKALLYPEQWAKKTLRTNA